MGRANLPNEGATLKRSGRIVPLPKLDRRAREPLHAQVHGWLRRAIWGGELPAGSVLPSTRALAKQLGVSRNTVLYAYEALAAEGLIGGLRGSGTRILETATAPKRHRDLRWILRESHYPVAAAAFADPDGNSLYAHS